MEPISLSLSLKAKCKFYDINIVIEKKMPVDQKKKNAQPHA